MAKDRFLVDVRPAPQRQPSSGDDGGSISCLARNLLKAFSTFAFAAIAGSTNANSLYASSASLAVSMSSG